MSPRADVRDPGEGGGTYTDRKGDFLVRYKEIAIETMKPKSPDSPFRESLRVVFNIEGKPDDTVSLGVAIEDPADDLWGFVPDPGTAPRGDEVALRKFIGNNIVREPVTVYVSGFVQSRQAPAGAHVFVRILRVYRYVSKNDGNPRLGMVAVTRDGLTTSWNCPEPQFDKLKGDTPDDDRIGPLSADTYAFQYLQMFGLDWERMKADLTDAVAYWPGHYDSDGQPIEPLFPDTTNPWPGFLRMIDRHGWKSVKMEIEQDPQYGLGPKRIAKGLVKMIEVDAGGKAPSAEFEIEKGKFLAAWDNLTQAILNDASARFIAGTNLTKDGTAVALATVVPLVRAHPKAVLAAKPDGSPAACFPPTPETWDLNGLVAASLTAERLAALGPEKLFELVALGDAEASGQRVVEWAKGAVPEWEGAGFSEGGDVL